MRCLALDVGDERIGVAMSDERGFLARPLEIIARRAGPASFCRVAALVAEYDVRLIVVGLPLLVDGSEGKQAHSARAYVRGLEGHIGVPVAFWDERLSTQQARAILGEIAWPGHSEEEHRSRGSRKRQRRADDDVAAAVILQEYLNAQSESRDRVSGDAQSGGEDH
jgi:putative Holliday junction resolvase